MIPVIPVPVLFAPGVVRINGKHMLGVFDFASILPAELLAKLYRTCRAELYTASAGYTLVLLYAGYIGIPAGLCVNNWILCKID